jgi:hypothetical protein
MGLPKYSPRLRIPLPALNSGSYKSFINIWQLANYTDFPIRRARKFEEVGTSEGSAETSLGSDGGYIAQKKMRDQNNYADC